MSRQDISNVALDLSERATDLLPELEAMLSKATPDSQLHKDLKALQLRIAGIRTEGQKLHTLLGTAVMTHDLPQPQRERPLNELPLFQTAAAGERSLTADELEARMTDRRMAAANDHTLSQ